MDEPVRAHIRSASGRTSKVIKDRQRVEVYVKVPGMGRLTLSVDSEGRYTLRASPQGGEASASPPLATGEMGPVEHEPD